MQFWQAPVQLRMAVRPAHAWPAGLRGSTHRHAFHELAFVIQGACVWRLGKRRVPLAANELLLLPPRRDHSEEVSSQGPAHMFWVGFSFDAEPAGVAALCDRAWKAGRWAQDVVTLGDMLYREHQRPDEAGAEDRAEHLLRALLVTLARVAGEAGGDAPETKHGAALLAAAHTLRRNLVEPPRAGDLARVNGLTPAHFATLFRGMHGVTPRAFLQQARLAEAKRRLRETRETVKEIAAACGYVGAPHFCRLFRNAEGVSPLAWRRAAAESLPS